MKQATQEEYLDRIRDDEAKKHSSVYIDDVIRIRAYVGFECGFDKGAEEMAKIKDAQIEKLVEALENIASEYSEDIFDEGYNPHQNPAFTMANKALEKFRKGV